MSPYDFSSLSPIEFEDLAGDLLGQTLGARLERFCPGRDEGVDLRGLRTTDGQILVQCKHYFRTGWPGLLRAAKAEAAKLVDLEGTYRYIFVTSVPMTIARKRKLREVFCDWIDRDEDIIGPEDLNALLRHCPEVEKSHFKLWLESTAILQSIFNANVLRRSKDLLEDVREGMKLFVRHEGMKRASETLEHYNVVILAGNPGIGKTALAHALLFHLAESGFHMVAISQDIDEGDRVWGEESKQVFFYDDFLGQAGLAEKYLSKNEDDRIARFARRCRRERSGAKKLVLTTREYILEDAKRYYHKLLDVEDGLVKCVIDIRMYGERVRAQILYNHIWFSGVSSGIVRDFVESRAYVPVVLHPNYNPRIVATVVRRAEEGGVPLDGLGGMILDALQRPEELWLRPFEDHLNEYDRSLVLAAASFGYDCIYDDVETAAEGLHLRRTGVRPTNADFRKSLGKLVGSFVAVNRVRGSDYVSLGGPAIRDVANQFLVRSSAEIDRMIAGAQFLEQLSYLLGIGRYSAWTSGDPANELEGRKADILRAMLRLVESPLPRLRLRQVSEESRVLLLTDYAESFPVVGEWIRDWMSRKSVDWRRGVGSRNVVVEIIQKSGVRPDPALVGVARELFFRDVLRDRDDFWSVVKLWFADPGLITSAENHMVREAFEEFVQSELGMTRDYSSIEDMEGDLLDLARLAEALLMTDVFNENMAMDEVMMAESSREEEYADRDALDYDEVGADEDVFDIFDTLVDA
ncbi:MAG: restriction endonuclease [Deltaproteobacteria bacterium]|nr:restriction endonuclease [Deltaproteobacteria bacterium]